MPNCKNKYITGAELYTGTRLLKCAKIFLGGIKINILIACEESQAVCKAFRAKGHNAFSCDVEPCSGGHPEWHLRCDVIPLLNGNVFIETEQKGTYANIDGRWDMIIAHPPCTFLTIAANKLYNVEKYGDKAIQRIKDREIAIEFFMEFVKADCDKKLLKIQ